MRCAGLWALIIILFRESQRALPAMTKALRWSPLLALLWPVFSFAQGSASLTCTPPATNNDGSALVTPIKYKFYMGGAASALQTSCAYVWGGLAPGTYTFTATAIDALNRESATSNSATKTILAVPVTIAGPVFSLQITKNSMVIPQIATVVAGKPCDPSQQFTFGGQTYMRTDTANVVALGNVDLSQTAVWTKCQ